MTRSPTSVPAEIARGTLDADLGALVWLLVEAGVPLTVTGPDGTDPERLREAIVELSGGMVPGARPGGLLGASGHVDRAGSLDELLRALAAPPHSLSDDQLRDLGVVLVLGAAAGGTGRVVAAHYLRPVERDREGHLQRRPPALLSARDARSAVLEHYHWAVATELASRAGMTMAAFDRQHQQRAALLAGLADAGIHEPAAVARAVSGFRLVGAGGDHERH